MSRIIYLDCDGVMADFDRSATEILGMPPGEFEFFKGEDEFWRQLSAVPDFYTNLPLMVDALELYNAVSHLGPIILTGVPRGDWAAPQKLKWGQRHLPNVSIITCKAADKHKHCTPGDVLIDDRSKYQDRWENRGGIFILHRSASESLDTLRSLGIL